MTPTERLAVVHGDASAVEAQLPANYEVAEQDGHTCVIRGVDQGDQTLERVLDQLAAKPISGDEITATILSPPPGL